jgi:hypothetical protein
MYISVVLAFKYKMMPPFENGTPYLQTGVAKSPFVNWIPHLQTGGAATAPSTNWRCASSVCTRRGDKQTFVCRGYKLHIFSNRDEQPMTCGEQQHPMTLLHENTRLQTGQSSRDHSAPRLQIRDHTYLAATVTCYGSSSKCEK